MYTVSYTQQRIGEEPRFIEGTNIPGNTLYAIMYGMLVLSLKGTHKFSNVTFKRTDK